LLLIRGGINTALRISDLQQLQVNHFVDDAREELKLRSSEPAWREAYKYVVGWAEEEVEKYIAL